MAGGALGSRWFGFSYGCALWGASSSPDATCGASPADDVHWMLDALRGSEVLVGLVERSVVCFLDGLCEQVEGEAWLADGAIFGADVCVKFAKVVVQRVRAPKRRVIRLYTGVLSSTWAHVVFSSLCPCWSA